MNGTSISHDAAIDLMPPRITTAVRAMMTTPGDPCADDVGRSRSTSVEIELAWTMLPMPKAAMHGEARRRATPSHFCLRPRSRTYIGPPAIVPLGRRDPVLHREQRLGVLRRDAEARR